MQRNFAAIPFVEAHDWSRHLGSQVKRNIVLHCMEVAEKNDRAEWCADYFAGRTRNAKGEPIFPKVSAHACVDSDSVVQCVPWDRVAWHAPGCNQQGIGIEMAGRARQSLDEWRDVFSMKMVDLTAWLTAQLCDQFDIPVEVCDEEDLRAKRPGITTHAMVSRAFGKSTHTDPGSHFPFGSFLELVRSYAPRGA